MKKLLSVLLSLCLVFSMVTVAAVSVGAATVGDDAKTGAGTTTIHVGVISYVKDDLGLTGWQVHYWGGSSGASDANMTATGKTEQKAVGSAYWNNAAQTFTMFTAEIPSDSTGYKVHNGSRWFGDDADATVTTAYIFNYDGDKALYETGVVVTTTADSLSTDHITTDGIITGKVLNQKGAQLPSTGGSGTTMIYIIGVILLAGAGILLVTRRRMKAE